MALAQDTALARRAAVLLALTRELTTGTRGAKGKETGHRLGSVTWRVIWSVRGGNPFHSEMTCLVQPMMFHP